MKIWLLRHGQAETQATSDSQRQLTSQGAKDVLSVFKKVQAAALNEIQAVYASPYVRAQQTAAIAKGFLPGRTLNTTHALTPVVGVSDLVVFLEGVIPSLASQTEAGEEGVNVLLVSHQPLVGDFLDWLCGLRPGEQVMSTSTLACIETDVIAASCGYLSWIKHPQ